MAADDPFNGGRKLQQALVEPPPRTALVRVRRRTRTLEVARMQHDALVGHELAAQAGGLEVGRERFQPAVVGHREADAAAAEQSADRRVRLLQHDVDLALVPASRGAEGLRHRAGEVGVGQPVRLQEVPGASPGHAQRIADAIEEGSGIHQRALRSGPVPAGTADDGSNIR